MRVALLTTDNREDYKDYGATVPSFGTAPEALLQGFAHFPQVEVHVVSCTQQPVAAPQKLASNIFFHSLLVPKLGWARTAYQGCIRAVRQKLKAIQPDVVHGQGTERDCAMSAVFSGYRNVLTIHGNMRRLAWVTNSRSPSYWWLAAWLETLALKRAGGVFCNSEHTERLVKPQARRVWRVPNAVREQFFTPMPEPARPARCTLVNAGYIAPGKRQLELLDVIQQLGQQGLKFDFQFVGRAKPGSRYVAAFIEKIKPLEQAGFARYLGLKPVSELIALFDASAAMVHVPPEEAFGLVVAEALARGLKFFGTRAGGIPDITHGMPQAELFGVEDWRGLSSAIATWIRSGFPRSRDGVGLMRSRYHPQVIAKRHLEIYQEVLRDG
jgi:glycosyltransferase involved in cell wall biosynthesis